MTSIVSAAGLARRRATIAGTGRCRATGTPRCREGQRDPAGADGELERPPVPGEPREEVDGRRDDVGVELGLVGIVVLARDVLAEMVL